MSHEAPNLLNDTWECLEAWVDPTGDRPYILVLLQTGSGLWQIKDPAENYRVLFSTHSYEEAKLWLLEDEYECVEGRLVKEDSEV